MTHPVDRPRDRGKDGRVENSRAGEGGRARWEGGRENKDHVFTRERRNASLEMSQYCRQPPHSPLSIATKRQWTRLLLALGSKHT